MKAAVAAISSLSMCALLTAVPPDACFANFRWEDCGGPPQPVMYYWKPGSRCEVGIWRGCLPSVNMFKDEYECVSTCIFTVRAQPDDYHNQHLPFDEYEDTTIGTDSPGSDSNESDGNSTVTGTGDGSMATDGTGGTGDGAATKADGDGSVTNGGDADNAATTAAGEEAGGETGDGNTDGGEVTEPPA